MGRWVERKQGTEVWEVERRGEEERKGVRVLDGR